MSCHWPNRTSPKSCERPLRRASVGIVVMDFLSGGASALQRSLHIAVIFASRHEHNSITTAQVRKYPGHIVWPSQQSWSKYYFLGTFRKTPGQWSFPAFCPTSGANLVSVWPTWCAQSIFENQKTTLIVLCLPRTGPTWQNETDRNKQTNTHTHTYSLTHTHTQTHTWTHTHAHLSLTQTHTSTHTHAHAHTHTCTHTHAHLSLTHTDTHTHAQKQKKSSQCVFVALTSPSMAG